ncbi:retrovirus-related Pol polyprotein from transposon TNT 1-94 [Gossypium australe]|uniref:Retrovirus-related Pol polyprotein from transposon TNT 1-94 n=1 Tax=Gossypium australe TaxID=47621 RepID=A0A5B6WE56_9ROSI|nr:retrovirus-related Pol polyprotein from transposon TNT 1-94 [Gossypium australe]
MDNGIASIERSKTWELSELPKGQKTIGVKWAKLTDIRRDWLQRDTSTNLELITKEVFAPIARQDTIRLVVALAAQNSWSIFQLDVFIDQPLGYIKVGNEHKTLYYLKQAPRAWYSRIDAYFLRKGFSECPYEHTFFVRFEVDGKMLIVCLYVDDLIYTGDNMEIIEQFKNSMMSEFDMSNLGLMHYFLGIEVVQFDAGIFISQKRYVQDILTRFRMQDCNPVCTLAETSLKLVKDLDSKNINNILYKQIVGSLMYVTTTRPDIILVISLISRFMENPTEMHLTYLQGTTDYGIFYKEGEKSNLIGFTDNDYAGDQDDRKSTSGYVFMMGSKAISWSSRKQPIVTLSTTEAEFVAATSCASKAIWLRNVLKELHFSQEGSTPIYCDNNSTIKLSKIQFCMVEASILMFGFISYAISPRRKLLILFTAEARNKLLICSQSPSNLMHFRSSENY